MRRITFLFLMTLMIGCQSTVGPLASRKREQKPDPLYNIEEQQRWGRERYPYIEGNQNIAPNTLSDKYGPTGR